jgi:transposase-like protein
MPMTAGASPSPACSAPRGQGVACIGCTTPWRTSRRAHDVAAAIRQAFLQPVAEAAQQTWGHVADQLRARWPKFGTLMDDSEHDVLASMTFPAQHRTKLHSTNPLERLNKEVKRGPTSRHLPK